MNLVARIVIEQLAKFFTGPRGESIRAVKDLNLTVEDGELLTLVGPSGCGKTTTLRLVSGLEKPSSGGITIDGRGMNGVAAKERNIAMVFQNPALYPHLTARENICFGLKLRKCPRMEQDRRLQEATELLDLRDCLDRRPAELSGGQCQRVALGRAIVRRPALFLFDEPLSSLDPRMRGQLRTEISRLHKKLGVTMIYVTHDQAEAMMLGERIAVMNEGTIQQVASPDELYRKPINVFVAAFIGSAGMNFFEGTVVPDGNALRFDEQIRVSGASFLPLTMKCPAHCVRALQAYTGKSVLLGIRPEDTRCQQGVSATPGSEAMICGKLEFLEPVGGGYYLHLRRGQVAVVVLTSAHRVSVDQTICVTLDPERARFFDLNTRKAIPCES